MTIGDIIKQYREKHNISMEEFSKRSSLSKGYISMLENNINPRNNKPIAPTLPTIRKIALGMNIDTDILLKTLDDNQEISLDSSDSDTNGGFVEPLVSSVDGFNSEDIDFLKQYHSLDLLGQEHVQTVLSWEAERMLVLKKQRKNTENTIKPMPKLPEADISAIESAMSALHEEKKKFNGKNWLNK